MARADMAGMFWNDTPPPKPPKKEAEKRTPPERTWESPDYLPNFKEAIEFKVEVMDDMQLYQAMLNQERLVFDIECYKNYFLAAFASIKTGKVWFCEFTKFGVLDTVKLEWVMQNFLTIGFNTIEYDIPITTLALNNRGTEALKEASDQIILYDVNGRDLVKMNKLKKLKCKDGTPINHIDLIEVAPLQASLKIYGGRLHTPRMQDLPFDPAIYLSDDQITCTRWYCINDLVNTRFLYEALIDEVKLRERMSSEYGMDLRSKSDAQIAEAVIASEITSLNGGRRPQKPEIMPGTWYQYQMPVFVTFYTDMMRYVQDVISKSYFVVGESGAIGMPASIADLEIRIANGCYSMGIGGLHSTEKSIGHIAGTDYELIDRDVTSYYPFIILLLRLFPKHLGENFLRVYNEIVQRRISAKKRAKEIKKLVAETIELVDDPVLKAELTEVSTMEGSLKITINGSFGKLGNKYSIIYAPDLLIQVTVTGQLCLLMLIERMELSGIQIVSANTDGIVMRCHKALIPTMDAIIKRWEYETGFSTEDTQYLALYSRDVNNYVAVKRKYDYINKVWLNEEDGCKLKGIFSKTGLHKNPQNEICSLAVVNFLSKGIPIEKTIRECMDITKFVNVRTVKGGGVKVYDELPIPSHGTKEELIALAGFYSENDYFVHANYGDPFENYGLQAAYETAKKILSCWKENEYLGKAIRWYYATGITGAIVYAKSGNQVPRSEGAKPCMDLPKQFPTDIDYDWYIKETQDLLVNVGYA